MVGFPYLFVGALPQPSSSASPAPPSRRGPSPAPGNPDQGIAGVNDQLNESVTLTSHG